MGTITTTNYYPLKQRRSDDNLREQARNRALLQAAAEGQTIRTNKLLRDGADIDYVDKYNWTALHHAAYSGFEDTVETLLSAGADVNARSIHFGTPLALAALKGRLDITRSLLRSRASVKSEDGLMLGTVLQAACAGGNMEIIEKLLSEGADVGKLARINTDIIDLLLQPQDIGNYLDLDNAFNKALSSEYYFEPDSEEQNPYLESGRTVRMPVRNYTTPINVAALYTDVFMVNELLESDADRAFTVLLYLSAYGKESVLEEVLTEFDDLSGFKDFSSFFVSAAAYAGNHECLRHLLQKGASPYPKDSRGMTARLSAAGHGHAKCLELLMERRDFDKDRAHFESHEATPIMDAAQKGRRECVSILLRFGVSLQPLKYPGRNALHCAVDSGDLIIVENLVKAGIDINSQDESGWTPLMCSLFVHSGYGEVFQPRQRVIQKLTSLGADSTINDIAQVLIEHGREDAVAWLEKAGS